MAAAPTFFDRTDIFASRNENSAESSLALHWADVLARQDRRPTPVALSEPRRLPVRLSIGSNVVEFAYLTSDNVLPRWARPVLESLAERWGARPGWDTYRAEPTNPHLVVNLLNILSSILEENSPPPQITPLADGGVQAEWHHDGRDLEIVVTADEPPTYFYFDAPGSHEEEAPLADSDYDRVRGLIGHLG